MTGYSTAVDLSWRADGPSLVVLGDNLPMLAELPDESITLVYIDPPFNTGRRQARQTLRTTRSDRGDRVGFKGATYTTVKGSLSAYDDAFRDYWAFLEPRLEANGVGIPSGCRFLPTHRRIGWSRTVAHSPRFIG